MQVLESIVPRRSAPELSTEIPSTEEIPTDRDGLLRWHLQRARCRALPASLRKFHLQQALILGKRPVAWNWLEFTAIYRRSLFNLRYKQ